MKPNSFEPNSTERFSIIMGINEVPYLGEGWMERELASDGTTYRATHPNALLTLPAGRAATLSILLCAPPAQPERPFTVRFTVSTSDREAAEEITPFTLHFPHWSLRELELPAAEGPRRITITADHPWRPADLFHNNDGRIMGILVNSLSSTNRS